MGISYRRSEITVKARQAICPLGNGRQTVDVDVTCLNCDYFREIMPKDIEKCQVAKVHCIVPTKFYRDIIELVEITHEEEK